MIVLGTLVTLLSGSGSVFELFLSRYVELPSLSDWLTLPPPESLLTAGEHPAASTPVMGGVELMTLLVAGVIVLLGVASVGLFLLIATAIVALIASGGLIASADRIEGGKSTNIREALRAGWHRGLELVLVASIPPIPLLVGLIIATILIGRFFSRTGVPSSLTGAQDAVLSNTTLSATLAVILLPSLALSLGLGFIQVLAYRACMLEEANATASFRRGWQIVRKYPLPVVTLTLIDLGTQLLLNLLLAVVGLITLICLPLRLGLWVIGGTATAFLSCMWTLAWREWTNPSR
mgnify:CR=1 FL=1